ncbi:MAG: MmgE/PrpD family protein [candidate division NC10 bacterium]|nr:MmgE/PrpD family protein [candidate division NC10 bacterium]
MSRTIAEQLAAFTELLEGGLLPDDVRRTARLCLLDWFGSALAGARAKPTGIVLAVARDLGGRPEATLLPDGAKTSAPLAALVNAASSHVVEMDDVHRAAVFHPGATVIPAALAMAEREGAGGLDLLAAIVAGYEVGIRLGEAAGQRHYDYWHTTGTCGTFAAAAAAGKLLGLETRRLAAALGSAGTAAAGLWEFLVDGAMSKQLHPAKAAHDGILCALLAEQGFTAAARILEGEKGFLRAMAQGGDASRLTDGLGGGTYRILETSFKAHAACYHIHSSIDAALLLRERHRPDPMRMRSVTVRLYGAAYRLLEPVEPVSPYAAKFSVPYCVATALLHGRVGPDAFTEARLADEEVQTLLGKVRLLHDPALDATYPEKWPAVVELETAAGTDSVQVDVPRGDPSNPVSEEELLRKFDALAGALPPEDRRRLAETCLNLEKVENVAAALEGLNFSSLPI